MQFRMMSTILAGLVVLPLPAIARPAAPAVSAKAFVDGLYRPWMAAARTGGDYAPPADGRVYAPELARLIARDAAQSEKQGEPGAIDWVILCGCQDDTGLKAVVTIDSASATAATARVRFPNFTPPAGLTLKLVRQPAGWRVADVITPGDYGGSVVALLRAALSPK